MAAFVCKMMSPSLDVEKYMLTDGQPQLVLVRLQSKTEPPDVVADVLHTPPPPMSSATHPLAALMKHNIHKAARLGRNDRPTSLIETRCPRTKGNVCPPPDVLLYPFRIAVEILWRTIANPNSAHNVSYAHVGRVFTSFLASLKLMRFRGLRATRLPSASFILSVSWCVPAVPFLPILSSLLASFSSSAYPHPDSKRSLKY